MKSLQQTLPPASHPFRPLREETATCIAAVRPENQMCTFGATRTRNELSHHEAWAGASRATRGHAHRTSQPPHPQHGGEVSLANVAEGAKLALAGYASAAAGEQGVCAPRAAAPAGSHEPPSRGSSQESGSIR